MLILLVSKENKRYEVDLYEPIAQYFTGQDYVVHGEVKDCDMTAHKEDELIIIELKKSLTVELLIQAAKRQRLTELVYIAIPKPTYRLSSQKWRNICYLMRRLELGLIIVTFRGDESQMEIVFEPKSFDRVKSMKRSKKKRDQLLAELDGRHANYNVGGSTQTKIMTAYKENCIHIACCLARFGASSPKSLRQLGTGQKTQSVLSKNYYGWFTRIERGIYDINERGLRELTLNEKVSAYYFELINEDDGDQKIDR